MKKKNFTQEQIDYVLSNYSSMSISCLAREIGMSRTPVKRLLRELGVYTPKEIAIEWTDDKLEILKNGYESQYMSVGDIANILGISSSTITSKAVELGYKKKPKIRISKEQFESLPALIKEKSLREIANDFNIDEETVREYLKKHGIKKKDFPAVNGNQKVPADEQFFKDISNPRYSAPDLAEKYNVSDFAIHYWRKKLFGEFKPQIHTTLHLTTAEKKVLKVLDELDIVYVTNKKIDKWIVDIYLGQKGIIEVDGTYWHNLDIVKEKDKRKLSNLQSLGYNVLVIKEEDLHDIQSVKNKVSSFWVSLVSNDDKNNVVNS